MARKSEKSKAKAKSPDKSPRRVGRPSRRRKKSDSESSEEKKTSEPAEVEQGESSESGRMRRSTRRQPEPSTSEPKPQTNEWKEDESFWSKDKEEEDKNKTEAGQEDGGTVWKVQTSNGSGGEIQKLRICRQRPGGAGSDSAESSMSPAKDSSSPHHKKALKKESQKSPLVESSLAEIELPPTAGTSVPQDTSEISLPPNQASDDAVPETNSMPQKVVEYVYETQPSVAVAEKNSPPQVNDSDSASVEAKDKILPPIIEQTVEESQPVEESPTVEKSQTVKESPTVEESKSVEDSQTIEESQLGKETVQKSALDKKDQDHAKEVVVSQDTPAENQPGDSVEAEVKVPEPGSAKEEANSNKGEEEKPVESVEDIPPPVEPPPEAQSEVVKPTDPDSDKKITENEKVDDKENDHDMEKETTETSQPESSRSPAKDCDSATVEVRRKSDSSMKSGGSRRSSVSGPSNSEYNEPLLEISVNKSPMQEGKEEGEIVDDEKNESSDNKDKRRVIKIQTKSEEATPAKINVTRRSAAGESSTPNNTSKTGSSPGTPATTAKKHPLITGPEPDESPALRRRKLTALATTRTITAGGTSRPVRSIPGEALKAVLLPEADKKDKEKRPKLIKVKDEKPESGGDEVPTNESKVNKVEDIREILKNNRANEKKAAAEKESKHLAKSPVRATFSTELKAPTRKVSISAAPAIEEVKASKPSRSKSPGDSKATPILFITNLVRPFTSGQLKELLARTGTIVRNGFFIDRIKSKCFVKYADVEMATETRHALNGVRWPVSNPKVLKVAYATDKELKVIQDSAEGEVVDDITSPRSSGSAWLSSEQAAVKDKEKRKTAGPSTREWDRGKTKTGSDGDVIFIDEYSKEEKLKNATMLLDMERSERAREHLNKEKPMIKDDHLRNHSDRDKERDRERRKRRSTPVDIEITSPPPARKFKKKDYDAPAKLLDDLFRKTKTSPCLYWLPLSAEQIAVKEETRRKHMAEHERRMAELKKSTQPRRDKERDRDRRRK